MLDKGFKNRAYCICINNYSEEEWKTCLELDAEFSVFAKEIGEECGTPHIQGYAYFKSAIAFTTMKRLFPRANFKSPPKGTPQQNLTYIEGPYDDGEGKIKPYNPDAVIQGECPRQGTRSDLSVVKEILADTGKMRDVVLAATSYQSIRHAEVILKYHETPRTWKPVVEWFYGSTGTGKSKTAYEILGDDTYTCMSTAKWFEGYDAHENVLIDDMRKDFCKFHELLRLLDRYALRVEGKGGSRQFLAKHIIITSCYHPSAMFDTREDVHQLIRRIDNIREFQTNEEILHPSGY